MALQNLMISRRTLIGVGGITLAIGASACTSASSSSASTTVASNSSTTSSSGKVAAKNEVKNPNIVMTKLNGTDTQIAFSQSLGSQWANQKITLSAVAPASLSTTNGEQTMSFPIASGTFQYDKTDQTTAGYIVHTGGFRLGQSGKSAVMITNMKVDMSSRTISATVDGTPDVAIFTLNGAPAVSQQGVQTVIFGLTVQLSPNATPLLQNDFPSNRSLGAMTITVTNSK